MTMQLIISAVVAVAFIIILVFKKKIGEKRISLLLKIFSVALVVLFTVRSFLNDNFIWIINGGVYSEKYYKTHDYFQSILRWGMLMGYVAYPCAIFFKSKFLKNVSIYFCLPFAILNLVFYNSTMAYFLTNSGRAIYTASWLRHAEYSLELVLLILFPLLLRFALGVKFDVKNKKEWGTFFGLLPLALLVVIPVTVPQSLFGFTNRYMVIFTAPHLLWIAVILLMLGGLYLGFRFKDRDTRYCLCAFLTIYLFLHYNQIYLMDLKMSRLPFQLCNLGSYLILLAIIIKKQNFFNFVLLANVPGAMIAFLAPDISEGMLSYWNIHFYIEHTWVFIIPILLVALRIFERPKKNAIKHFFVGFSSYFVFCAFGGIIANCVLYKPFDWFFNHVNYFYLFNDTVVNVFAFLVFTRRFNIVWNGYKFYPIYMLLIYVLFTVFCMVCYYVYTLLCKVGDNHFEMRKYRIEMNRANERYKKYNPKVEYED